MTLKRQIGAVGVLPGTVNNLLTIKRPGLVKMHLPQSVNLIVLEWLDI